MSEEILYYPARVVRARSPLAQMFPGDEQLLALYQERYPDSEAVPYFLRTEISNNSLDHYFTHMLTDTLNNFAEDANGGVGLQDSHSTLRLGYGRSLFGRYAAEPGTPPGWDRRARRGYDGATLAIPVPTVYERVLSAAYIVPGINLNNLTYASTDDFIRAANSGSVEEISVGFGSEQIFCDICNANYWSWDCSHVAGFTYAVDKSGQEINLLATARVKDARLFEYSVVYAGATPNAVVIRKARQEAEGGRLTRKQVEYIEERYRVKLPGQRNWSGVDISQENNTMNELDQIRAILAEAEAPPDPVEGVRWLVEQMAEATATIERHTAHVEEHTQRVTELEAEISRLQPLADDGAAYRADLVEQALAEGVRAMGAQFPEETYRGLLVNSSLDHIKRIRDSFAEQARAIFPGGRQSIDVENSPQRPAPETPDLAYAG